MILPEAYLKARTHDDELPWEVAREMTFADGDKVVRVPAGFKTNLASVPRFFWRLIPPFGRYTVAAVIHDWLYTEKRLADGTPVDKEYADELFLRLMEEFDVDATTRGIMYTSVHLAGQSAWEGEA